MNEITAEIPDAVVQQLAGPNARLLSCAATPISRGAGSSTSSIARVAGDIAIGLTTRSFSLIRKEFRPAISGRHTEHTDEVDHWSYWRRELNAYSSDLLPRGSELATPRCYGVSDNAIYLQDIDQPCEDPGLAAYQLGNWQSRAGIPNVPWLAGHQLAQRLARTDLDWSRIDAHAGITAIWKHRCSLLQLLDDVPRTLSHGDFHRGNLLSLNNRTIAIDWGTLGISPIGSDLAHLTLSTLEDHTEAYLKGIAGVFTHADVLTGYRATLALTGASRIHWMLSRGAMPPPGYQEFVLDHAAELRL